MRVAFETYKKPKQEIKDWKEKDFDALKRLAETKGILLEVAGPTEDGYELVDINKLPKKLFISNIAPGKPQFDPETGKFIGYGGKVDFVEDATKMTFNENSVGAVFCSCIGSINVEGLQQDDIRKKTIKEAFRVLEPGGLLIWQGGNEEEFSFARECGFRMVQCKTTEGEYKSGEKAFVYSYIFEKPKK